MPIPVGCQCGQKFAAPDNLAGKAVRCPNCKNPLQIPNPQAQVQQRPQQPQQQGGVSDLLDEVGVEQQAPVYQGPSCPECSEPVKEEQILCVNCGYNLQTKKKLKTKIEAEEHEIKEVYGNHYLDRAAHNMDQKSKEIKIKERSGIPWWALLVIVIFCGTSLLAGAAFVITPNVDENGETTSGSSSLDPAFLMGLAVMSVIFMGGIINVIGWVQLLMHAFNESSTEGCLVLLIPNYWLAYIFERWDDCRDYLNFTFGGTCMVLFPLVISTAFVEGIGVLHLIVAVIIAMLIGVGTYVIYTGRLLIVVKAFRDDTTQGVMTLFIPIYDFVYAAKNWATCKSAIFIYIGGVMSVITGWLMFVFVIALVVVTDVDDGPAPIKRISDAELKKDDFRYYYAKKEGKNAAGVLYVDVTVPSLKTVAWHGKALQAFFDEGLPPNAKFGHQSVKDRYEWAIGPLTPNQNNQFIEFVKTNCDFGDVKAIKTSRHVEIKINLPLLQASKYGQEAMK
ncbi:MAG: hypothetical protein ACI9G1_003280 [Pirellulaceae bacterium]|jgi:hypothetical protein